MSKSINDLKIPMDAWQVAEHLYGKAATDANHLLAGKAALEMKKAGWKFSHYDDETGEEIWLPPGVK